MNRFVGFLISPLMLLLIAIGIFVHQYVFGGIWFQPEDIHHETFLIAFLIAAVVSFIYKKRWY